MLKDFLYCIYGYLTSRTKAEVYRVLNEIKLKCLKKYVIKKYYEQNKPISTLLFIKMSKSIKKVSD